jgi:hypothetical protein
METKMNTNSNTKRPNPYFTFYKQSPLLLGDKELGVYYIRVTMANVYGEDRVRSTLIIYDDFQKVEDHAKPFCDCLHFSSAHDLAVHVAEDATEETYQKFLVNLLNNEREVVRIAQTLVSPDHP